MKRTPLFLVLLLTVVSCNGLLPTEPSDGLATLSGVVTDPNGHAWGGVTLGIVHQERGVVADGRTNDAGRYSISRIPPGHYRVWLQLGRTGPGYFVGDIELREGHTTFDIVSR